MHVLNLGTTWYIPRRFDNWFLDLVFLYKHFVTDPGNMVLEQVWCKTVLISNHMKIFYCFGH